MTASAACPECHGPIAGLGDTRAAAGYCMACHIELARHDGLWARTPLVPLT